MTRQIEVGAHVTCERGHYVCEVIEPMRPGTVAKLDAFGAWAIPAPASRERFSSLRCPTCSAPWVTHLHGLGEDGLAICIERRWWPQSIGGVERNAQIEAFEASGVWPDYAAGQDYLP